MSHTTEATDIMTAFRAAWNETTYPIEWPNGPAFNPPTAGNGLWARFTILSGGFGAFQADMSGTPTHRFTGIVVLQGFCKLGVGEGALLTMLDTASAFFRSKRIGDALFRTPSVERIGPDGLGYYQANMNAPFQRDTIF